MASYLAGRVALGIGVLWLVSVLVFVLLRVAPGDAALAVMARSPGEGSLTPAQLDARRVALGLDQRYAVQYAHWISGLIRLDAGRSLSTGGRVVDEMAPRMAVTLQLTALAAFMMVTVAVPLGGLAGALRHRWPDHAVRALSYVALAVPGFWLGLVLVLVLAAWFGYLAAGGHTPVWRQPLAGLQQLAPAAAVLAVRPAAVLARVVRTATIDALEGAYVRTARAKGLGPAPVLWRHAARNAALPSVTVLGAQIVFLLGGAVVIEQVFNLPGIGRALVAGVSERDYPAVQFLVLCFAAVALAANLLIDLAYTWLDPRVRLA